MTLVIRGLGTALPPTRIQQEDCEQLALALAGPTREQATWLKSIYDGAGIKARNIFFSQEVVQDAIGGTEHTGSEFLPTNDPDNRGPTTRQRMQRYAQHVRPLACRAASAALAQSSISPTRFTHLVTVSCTGFAAPGFDVELMDDLGLPRTVERTHIGFMGCHGALNGLRVANAFLSGNPRACVLLCAVELCSLHYFYGWNPQRIVANALFADGAGAIVGVTGGAHATEGWKVVDSASCVFPNSMDAMTWTIGDHGFTMTLSKRVPQLIATHLGPWLSRWLTRHQLSTADIASWAIHPGGPKILDAVEGSLAIDPQLTLCSREILAEQGNMSSPTILFILQRLQKQHAKPPCVALGFGPGLTVEAALLF